MATEAISGAKQLYMTKGTHPMGHAQIHFAKHLTVNRNIPFIPNHNNSP